MPAKANTEVVKDKKSTALITLTQYELIKQKINDTIETQPRIGKP
ncbi:hypothetical protein GCM10019995_07980 [Lactobacillus kefiranofaciens subsp. kefirgranum]